MDINNIPVKIVRSHDELRKYRDGWNSLIIKSPQKSPMSSWCWLSTYFELRLKEGEDWFCVVAGTQEKVLGVLPVVVNFKKIFGWSRCILRTPSDNHTIGVDLVVDFEMEKQIIPLLIKYALKGYPSCIYFEFSQIAEHSPTLYWARLNYHKLSINIIEHIGKSSYLPTCLSFNDYRRTLNNKFRSNLNRINKNLNKISTIKFELYVGEDTSTGNLLRMAEVENKSWKGNMGTSILKSKSRFKFYTVLCQRLAKEKWLEWYFLSVEDETIASNLVIRVSDSIVTWKMGYDEKYKKYAPGNLLREHVIQYACSSDCIHEVNMVTDTKWHNNWNVMKRDIFRIRLFPNRPIPYFIGFLPMKLKSIFRGSNIHLTIVGFFKKNNG